MPSKITKEQFMARFPLPYCVQAINPFRAKELGLSSDVVWWEFKLPFRYVSDKYGVVDIPAGFITDFASVPTCLESIISSDAPEILFASAPHDFLFEKHGKRPGVPDLSFNDVNELLTEAMYYCGANSFQRAEVAIAVKIGGKKLWNKHANG